MERRSAKGLRRVRLPIALTLVACSVLGSTGVAAASNPAGSAIMNRSGAVSYADSWWNARNPQFPNYTSDCTNFLSQTWANGGGIPQVRDVPWTTIYGPWYSDSQISTPSWSAVENFRDYWVNKRKLAVMYQTNLSFRLSSGAQRGDGIAYHYDPAISGFHHVTVYIGFGTYVSSRDNPQNYPWTVIDQHTADRYHSPWNKVWLDEPDITKRNQMYAYTISYNDNGT